MELPARLAEGELAIDVVEGDDLRLVWRGKSNDREPGRFLAPFLAAALDRARQARKRVVMDFAAVDYMNSSTFTPIVKAIGEAKRSGVSVALVYDQARKWQAVSFSALKVFETRDGHISVSSK